KIKQWAFGIATAVLGIAGALLIIVAPVDPILDRAYIGRTFCVVVMAGLGSMTGTLIAAIILGVVETIVLTLFGASWAPAVSFALLLGVLAIRPQGLFGRRSCSVTAFFLDQSGPVSRPRLADDAGHRQPIPLLCRLRDPAIHRTRRRMEHPW